MRTEESRELKNAAYEVFMGALSILAIVNLFLVLAIRDDVVESVVVIMDLILSLIFLADFTFRFLTAGSRRRYFFRQFGWADLATSIPIPEAKVLRSFRVFRAVRLLRQQGPDKLVHDFIDNRAQSALLSVLLMIVLLLEFGGMGMAWAEQRDVNANIKTGGDSLWWAYVTITTVGYGDQYPVTTLGRVIGVVVLTAGVGLFAVFTGFLANFFLAPRRRGRLARGLESLDAKSMLIAARAQLEAQEKASSELRARLEDIERAL